LFGHVVDTVVDRVVDLRAPGERQHGDDEQK
jgi:hypothetical protein